MPHLVQYRLFYSDPVHIMAGSVYVKRKLNLEQVARKLLEDFTHNKVERRLCVGDIIHLNDVAYFLVTMFGVIFIPNEQAKTHLKCLK